MNKPDLYWVTEAAPLRLAFAPRPRSGEWLAVELGAWRAAGVDTIVSLLEASELRELELADEERICAGLGMQYLSFPIADREVPGSVAKTFTLAEELARQLRAGKGLAVHCRAGIGRSGLITACVLLRSGFAHKDVFALLTRVRGLAVPDTTTQVKWLAQFSRYAGEALA